MQQHAWSLVLPALSTARTTQQQLQRNALNTTQCHATQLIATRSKPKGPNESQPSWREATQRNEAQHTHSTGQHKTHNTQHITTHNTTRQDKTRQDITIQHQHTHTRQDTDHNATQHHLLPPPTHTDSHTHRCPSTIRWTFWHSTSSFCETDFLRLFAYVGMLGTIGIRYHKILEERLLKCRLFLHASDTPPLRPYGGRGVLGELRTEPSTWSLHYSRLDRGRFGRASC